MLKFDGDIYHTLLDKRPVSLQGQMIKCQGHQRLLTFLRFVEFLKFLSSQFLHLVLTEHCL